MRRSAAGLLALPALAALAGLALTDHNERSRPPPGPLLYERFDGRQLDRSRWRTCHWWSVRGCTIATNHELQWYRPGQARVRDGRLKLVAERRRVRGADGRVYRYRSGMISSGPGPASRRPRLAFLYGRIAVRARVPRGRGLWSGIWLLPASRRSEPEIDIMEVLGHRPRAVEMHLHSVDGGEERVRGSEWPGLRAGWHTFALGWRPGRLSWFVDGEPRWRVRGPAVPDERMYLVANLAVGGDWPGPPGARTRFPASLDIDWVKVWR